MLRTNYRCVQSPNISVDVAKCGEKFHKFTLYTHFLSVTKNDLSWMTIYSWVLDSLEYPLMLETNYRCVQPTNIRIDVAKCGEKFHKLTLYTHFLSVTKNNLSWQINTFMVRFLLISMSSYAKNKLQSPNISIDVAKCEENFTDSPSTHTVYLLRKTTWFDGTIYSW